MKPKVSEVRLHSGSYKYVAFNMDLGVVQLAQVTARKRYPWGKLWTVVHVKPRIFYLPTGASLKKSILRKRFECYNDLESAVYSALIAYYNRNMGHVKWKAK